MPLEISNNGTIQRAYANNRIFHRTPETFGHYYDPYYLLLTTHFSDFIFPSISPPFNRHHNCNNNERVTFIQFIISEHNVKFLFDNCSFFSLLPFSLTYNDTDLLTIFVDFFTYRYIRDVNKIRFL